MFIKEYEHLLYRSKCFFRIKYHLIFHLGTQLTQEKYRPILQLYLPCLLWDSQFAVPVQQRKGIMMQPWTHRSGVGLKFGSSSFFFLLGLRTKHRQARLERQAMQTLMYRWSCIAHLQTDCGSGLFLGERRKFGILGAGVTNSFLTEPNQT